MMAKRILVALDHTEHAESVLPLVADMARGSGATVRLLHVRPVPETREGARGRVIAYASQEMERLEAEGLAYLHAVAAPLEGVPVESRVRFGHAVEEIVLEAEAFGADLIAVASASRSALRRVAFGSVAEKVLKKATVPVMLLAGGVV